MSINKAQGQTLKHVGLWLPAPCFSHGQLYVALSRCSSRHNVNLDITRLGHDLSETHLHVTFVSAATKAFANHRFSPPCGLQESPVSSRLRQAACVESKCKELARILRGDRKRFAPIRARIAEATQGMVIPNTQDHTCSSAHFLQCTATVIPSSTLY